MRYQTFGRTGLRVSELFLGAMRFTDKDTARALVDRYADAGGNVIDTAVNYSGGESERILGELLAGRRDRFVVATKYTCSLDVSDPNAAGNHRKNLTRSLETSLRRLRTDRIDVYWVHMWDRHTPVDETMRALDDAVRAGKIQYVGISDAPAWVVSRANTLAEWRGWTPFAGLQVPYHLLWRDVERELLPMAEAFGMTVAAWGPLAHGALARGESAAVREVAGALGRTPAQVGLAWLRSRSPAVHPIVGASSVAQLDDSLGAVGVTLPDEAMRTLESAVDFKLGFPADFIAESEATPWVLGAAALSGPDKRPQWSD